MLNQAEELSQLRARDIQLRSQDMQIRKLRFKQRVEELTEEVEVLSQLVVGVHFELSNNAQLEIEGLRKELDELTIRDIEAHAKEKNY